MPVGSKSIGIEPGSSRIDCHRSGLPMKSLGRRGCVHPFLLAPPLKRQRESRVSHMRGQSSGSLDVTVLVIGVFNKKGGNHRGLGHTPPSPQPTLGADFVGRRWRVRFLSRWEQKKRSRADGRRRLCSRFPSSSSLYVPWATRANRHTLEEGRRIRRGRDRGVWNRRCLIRWHSTNRRHKQQCGCWDRSGLRIRPQM